jgi:hypothetical protein
MFKLRLSDYRNLPIQYWALLAFWPYPQVVDT